MSVLSVTNSDGKEATKSASMSQKGQRAGCRCRFNKCWFKIAVAGSPKPLSPADPEVYCNPLINKFHPLGCHGFSRVDAKSFEVG